jgi:hypothetical protein
MTAAGANGSQATGLPEERLERGGVLSYPEAPFPVPAGDDLTFLLGQRLGRFSHKNISYNPATGRAAGFVAQGSAETERLQRLFADFSRTTTDWLFRTFPRYKDGCELDRISFRPLEESTRRLRQTARNDLVHVDAFPGRPSQGRRILRVFVNVNPTEPRVWMTSDPFARLFARYGALAGLPGQHHGSWLRQFRGAVLGLFVPGRKRRSEYDAFMLRFHNFLKANDMFQEKGSKRLWTFPPGSAWVAMTDTCSHAVLRGRYALEHSYFVRPDVLALPHESPAAILAGACGRPVLEAA